MKILIIGGTRFVGRHFVTAALARGHELTLFNRGKHAPAVESVETITGDRHTDLAKLQGRRWDTAVTMWRFLEECKAVSGSDASFTWVDEEFLFREQVAAWSELPLWLPESAPSLKGFMFVSTDKAVQTGLRLRPVTDTISDTLRWRQTTATHEPWKAGLDPEKEQALLHKWHTHRLNG